MRSASRELDLDDGEAPEAHGEIELVRAPFGAVADLDAEGQQASRHERTSDLGEDVSELDGLEVQEDSVRQHSGIRPLDLVRQDVEDVCRVALRPLHLDEGDRGVGPVHVAPAPLESGGVAAVRAADLEDPTRGRVRSETIEPVVLGQPLRLLSVAVSLSLVGGDSPCVRVGFAHRTTVCPLPMTTIPVSVTWKPRATS